MENVWIQLILTVGTALGAVFTAYKFSISQAIKREKLFLDYLERSELREKDYNANKNGHLERISVMFSKTIDKNTRAVNKLSARIKENK